MCSAEIEYSNLDRFTPQMSYYEEIFKKAKYDYNLKMMIYSGDDDSVCSTASTQAWIYDVGVEPIQDKLWNVWKYKNSTAGYITEFDLGVDSGSSLVFVTVHGAGHEVPAYRPAEALEMLKNFLNHIW